MMTRLSHGLRRCLGALLAFLVDPFRGYEDHWPVVRKDPWWDTPRRPEVYLVDISFIASLACPDRLAEVQRLDRTWIDEIREDLAVAGFRRWLEIVVDDRGCLVLRDGYHRLVAAQELGLVQLPITYVAAERIPGYKRPIRSVIGLLSVLASTNGPSVIGSNRYNGDTISN